MPGISYKQFNEQTFYSGPIPLPAGADVSNPKQATTTLGPSFTNADRPVGRAGILAFDVGLVLDDPVRTPLGKHDHAVHLHHAVFRTSARADPICPTEPEHFVGTGHERTPVEFRPPYMYLCESGDQWDIRYRVLNNTPYALEGIPAIDFTVRISYTLRWIDLEDGLPRIPRQFEEFMRRVLTNLRLLTPRRFVTPFYLDATQCGGDSEYPVPADGGVDTRVTKARTFQAPWNGIAVWLGGHLHTGGKSISVSDDAVSTALTCYATQDPGHPHLDSIGYYPIQYRVVAGNDYTVTAEYSNYRPDYYDRTPLPPPPQPPPPIEVMGIALVYAWKAP